MAVCAPSPRRDGAPTAWAFPRFLANVVSLEEKTGAVSAMADALRRRLMDELPGFGRHLGYDGKALASHSTGKRKAATGRTSDPDADRGRRGTGGVDAKGKAWFGYGLHLVADAEHEIPVWFEVTKASASEHRALSAGPDDLFAKEPELAERCEDFCADRGLDGGPLRRRLWDVWRVRPLIDVREMWREEREMPDHDPSRPIRRPLAADGGGNLLHSEKGEVFCRCPATGEERPMAFQGFEADRGALKYRCPAAAYGFDCAGRERCLGDAGSKAGDYGRVVRVDLAAADRRMFTPTPWGSPSWRRGYARRSALERINARLDRGFRFENHFVRGKARMRTRIGLAVALGAVLAGRPARMRSLVTPACRSRPDRRDPRLPAEPVPAGAAGKRRPNANRSHPRGGKRVREGVGDPAAAGPAPPGPVRPGKPHSASPSDTSMNVLAQTHMALRSR